VAEDRYCTNCGQELQPEDQFCGNCGRPVRTTAHVPTPESDVPVPPPPQQAEARFVPSQASQTQSSQEQGRSAPRGPVWGLLAVLLVEWVVVTVQEIPAAPAGKDLGDQIASGLAIALNSVIATVLIILVVGAIYYAIARKRGVTFRNAVFNWPMVILAGLAASGSIL
jgi:hypothetical protein